MTSQAVAFNMDIEDNIKTEFNIAKDILNLIFKKGVQFCKSLSTEFELNESEVIKIWKKTVETNKKCMDVDNFQCIHILGGSGPNAGHKCGRRTAEENGLCSKHKPKDKIVETKPKCVFVFIEGKHKGTNCSKSQCEQTQKGFCSIHYRKFELSQGSSDESKSDNKNSLEAEPEEQVKEDNKKSATSVKTVETVENKPEKDEKVETKKVTNKKTTSKPK